MRARRRPGPARSTALAATRTADWSAADRDALASVVHALRPSPRHLTDILDWVDDIVARDGGSPGHLLADPALQAALRGGSAPDRLKRWKARLRRLRYPRLVARETLVAERIRALGLGAAIQIVPPPDLEGDELLFHLRARSAEELQAALERLRERLVDGSIAALFALLDEA